MRGGLEWWPVAVLVGVAVAVGLVWVVWGLRFPLRQLAFTAIVTVGTAALWFGFGGTVVRYLVWLVPFAVASVAVVLWPSGATIAVHTAILVLPLIGPAFAPIGRAYVTIAGPIEAWLLHRSLSSQDRRTRAELLRAIRANAELRADSGQLDDLPRALDAMRRHADAILSVEAPDLGWKRVIRDVAAPRLLYREMWTGQRPLDFEVAEQSVRQADRALREFLRSRSLGYRMLSHRFVEEEDRRR